MAKTTARPDEATEPTETIDEKITRLANEAPPFYRNKNLLLLYILIIPGCLMPAVTLGFDSAIMNGLQAVPTWDIYFGRPRGAILGLLSAIIGLGCVVATPFISVVGDSWGRRMGIFVGAVIMLIGGVIQGASINIVMFIMSRFIIGFGLVFANTYAPMLIGELAHPKDRQVITSLYQTSWYLGAVAAAWTTFGTFRIPNDWAWRIPSYLQAVPATIQIAGIWFLPESPRFLIAKGRPDEAEAFLFNFAFNALLYSYPVEVLPYPIRAKGFSVLMFFGKGASFVNGFVNPVGLQALGWKYYAVYVGWLCFELLSVYLWFPETSGRSLEAIAEVFDGPSAAVAADPEKLKPESILDKRE